VPPIRAGARPADCGCGTFDGGVSCSVAVRAEDAPALIAGSVMLPVYPAAVDGKFADAPGATVTDEVAGPAGTTFPVATTVGGVAVPPPPPPQAATNAPNTMVEATTPIRIEAAPFRTVGCLQA
jgi:hypothetical protein